MENINIIILIVVIIGVCLFLNTSCAVFQINLTEPTKTTNYSEKFDEKAPTLSVLGDSPDTIGVEGTELETTPPDTQIEKYTHDFYPWWRSPRWWNYDGWLYNRPYYNYWRRPAYYNMWFSGNPIKIGGKTFYKTDY